jgi:hypothetical protein
LPRARVCHKRGPSTHLGMPCFVEAGSLRLRQIFATRPFCPRQRALRLMQTGGTAHNGPFIPFTMLSGGSTKLPKHANLFTPTAASNGQADQGRGDHLEKKKPMANRNRFGRSHGGAGAPSTGCKGSWRVFTSGPIPATSARARSQREPRAPRMRKARGPGQPRLGPLAPRLSRPSTPPPP